MMYKIYLPNETKEKLLYAGTVQVHNNDITESIISFMREKKLEDLIISDQGIEGLSIWKDDEIYCLLRKI